VFIAVTLPATPNPSCRFTTRSITLSLERETGSNAVSEAPLPAARFIRKFFAF